MKQLLNHLPVFAILLFMGCSEHRTSHVTSEQLNGRLTAALAVNDMNQRDVALKSVAQDAAEAAQGEIVKRAVYEIHDAALMDQVTYDCALKLVERGQAQAAADAAKMLHDTSKANEVLGRIARGGK